MAIKIITDTACDLPKELIESLNIEALPIWVIIEEQEYLDGDTLKSEELYSKMRSGAVVKTAQINYKQFMTAFENCLDNGDTIICMPFSKELSGTYQTATLVKNDLLDKYPDADINIVDTNCVLLGLGMMVIEAAQMAKAGGDKEKIFEMIEWRKNHTEHVFTVDNLEYLCRGGRLSKTEAMVGSLLNIKPVLDVENGKLIPLEKKRGRMKSIKRLVELIDERGQDLENQTIGISHCDDESISQKIKEAILKNHPNQKFLVTNTSAAIGAHMGPGGVAIFFMNDKEPEYL